VFAEDHIIISYHIVDLRTVSKLEQKAKLKDNGKLRARNTTVQLLTLFTDPGRHSATTVTMCRKLMNNSKACVVAQIAILLHSKPRQNWQQDENDMILKCTHFCKSRKKSTKSTLGKLEKLTFVIVQ